VLAVLNVKRHAYTVSRGGQPGYPHDRLIFYAWTKPATMMCNQHSFSNAEIIAHAFKTLQRGPLVGTTTFGGVISTGAYNLMDGALVRTPGRGWYMLPGGVDMESHGAEPDVQVAERPADEVHGARPQLDAAIRVTLEQVERQAAQP
jgi:tricorn protease